eukprot:6925196-Pyramimonas_sp.AAC.2
MTRGRPVIRRCDLATRRSSRKLRKHISLCACCLAALSPSPGRRRVYASRVALPSEGIALKPFWSRGGPEGVQRGSRGGPEG